MQTGLKYVYRLYVCNCVQCFLFHMWKVACLGEMTIMKFKYWYCTDVVKGKGHNGDETHHATSHQVAYMDFRKQVYDNWGGGHASLCSFNHMKLNQSDLSADELARHLLSLRDPWHTELPACPSGQVFSIGNEPRFASGFIQVSFETCWNELWSQFLS